MLLGTTEEMWDDTLSWDIGEGHSYTFICDFMRDAVRMKYCGGPVSSLHFSRLVLFICPLDMNALHCLDRLEWRITGHFISSPSQKVCVRSSGCGGVQIFTCFGRASHTCLSTFPLKFNSHQLTFQTNPAPLTPGQPSTQQSSVNYNATH